MLHSPTGTCPARLRHVTSVPAHPYRVAIAGPGLQRFRLYRTTLLQWPSASPVFPPTESAQVPAMSNFPLASGRPGIPRRAAVATPAAASPDDRRLTHPAVEDRTAAPENRGETLTGEPISLAAYRGKTLVTNVRGSWCAPCRAEAPYLRKVSEDLRDQDAAFLKINTRDAAKDAAHRFENTYGITCPDLGDRNGRQLPKVKGVLLPSATPTTLVIDRPGRVAARSLQGLSETEQRSLIDPVPEEG